MANRIIKGYVGGVAISDADEAWRQLLILLQFNEETSEEMFCQGITSPKYLLELDNEYLKHFNKGVFPPELTFCEHNSMREKSKRVVLVASRRVKFMVCVP
jgi:hypothetical protein